MLLQSLNRKEKLKFLDLALQMVSIDGEPSNYEDRILNLMLEEIGEEVAGEYTFKLSDDYEKTIIFFEDAPITVKNIVFLNLSRLPLFDDLYNTRQHFFLEEIRLRFGITEAKKKQLMRLVYDERDLIEKAKRAVNS
ncbi:MAG: hypothetical protein GX232_00445 [Acholeplasmataceae bacterium]|jgi:hypothetical protein|nr:hypothetical protein [Acholeplasmataceae bacterium]